jgi:hypothetical protein
MAARTIISPGPPARSVFVEAFDAIERLEHARPENGYQLIEVTSARRENIPLVARLVCDVYMDVFDGAPEYMIPAADGKSYLSLPVPVGAKNIDAVQFMNALNHAREDITDALRHAQVVSPPITNWQSMLAKPTECQIHCADEREAAARAELLGILMQAHGIEEAFSVKKDIITVDIAAGNTLLEKETSREKMGPLQL